MNNPLKEKYLLPFLESQDTTRVYLGIDIESLRNISLEVPANE